MRCQLEAHAQREAAAALAAAYHVRRKVHRHQGGRARGVHARARTLQTQAERHAPSSRRHVVPRHRVHRRPRRRRLHDRPVGPLDADKRAAVATHQRCTPPHRAVQRRVPNLEEQPLLRVHCAPLRRAQPKRDRVESIDAHHEAAVRCARLLRRAERGGIGHDDAEHPPCTRHASHGVAARRRERSARLLLLSLAPTRPPADNCADDELQQPPACGGGRRRTCTSQRERARLTTSCHAGRFQHVARDRSRRRLLKHQRRRERRPHKRAQPRRQLRRRERVDACLHQWRLGADRSCGSAGQLAHHPQHARLHLGLTQRR